MPKRFTKLASKSFLNLNINVINTKGVVMINIGTKHIITTVNLSGTLESEIKNHIKTE